MVEQNFWEMLRAKHDSLTKSGTIVADYLVQHAEDAQYLSISSLAKACGVAEATIFRFCRSLGFDGYNEMKIALAKANAMTVPVALKLEPGVDTQILCTHAYNTAIEALNGTRNALDPDAIDQAATLLQRARQVYCFGQGGSRGGIGSDVLRRGFAAVGLFFGGDGRLGRGYGPCSLGRGRRRFPGFHAQGRFGRLVRGRAFHRRGNGRGGSGRGVLSLHGLCGGHGDGGLLLRGGRRFRGHRRCAGGRAFLAVGRGGAAYPGPGLFIQLGPGRHAHGDLLFRAGQLAGGIGIFFCHDGSLGDAAAPTR